MSYSINYTLTDIASQKVHENSLLVTFENDQDDGRDFFTAKVKDRHDQWIFRHSGSDYGKVSGELNSFLAQYNAKAQGSSTTVQNSNHCLT